MSIIVDSENISKEKFENQKETPAPIWENVPEELTGAVRQWVLWRYEVRPGAAKPTKVPVNTEGYNASTMQPWQWTTFVTARSIYEKVGPPNLHGIGFVLWPAWMAVVGIDLDGCRDNVTGVIEPWAIDIIKRLDSYTEVSPSGKGIRIFVRGTIAQRSYITSKNSGRNIEIYDSGRFLTVTGQHVDGTPKLLKKRTEELASVIDEIMPKPTVMVVRQKEKKPIASNGGPVFELVDFLERHQIEVKSESYETATNRTKYVLDHCPFNLDHVGKDAAIFQDDEGVLGFHCFHASCADKTWKDVRELFEPDRFKEKYLMDLMGVDSIDELNELALARQHTTITQSPETTISGTINLGNGFTDAREALVTHKKDLVIEGTPDPTAMDMTDVGNAMSFCQIHGHDLRWVREWGKWIKWNGVYWQPVAEEKIVADYVQPYVRETMPARGKLIVDDDKRKKWFGWVTSSNSANRVRALLAMAEPQLMVEICDLNANPNLFATKNAVIDLTTCKVVEPRREDYITAAAPVKFDPEAEAPNFEKFLSQILVDDAGQPCPEMVDYLQRVCGYALTPYTTEQIFFILHGTGKNGKSTFAETLLRLLGGYGIAGADSLFFDSDQRANNEDEARLYGVRLCVTSETKQSSYFSSAKIKRLTGSDKVVASFKYKSQFEFEPTHKLFLLCNHLPKFDPSDDAMVRRIKLIPFNFVVPEDQRDNALSGKLRAEASGILNWCLAGLAKWNGGSDLGHDRTPEIMRVATQKYLGLNDATTVSTTKNQATYYLVVTSTAGLTRNLVYNNSANLLFTNVIAATKGNPKFTINANQAIVVPMNERQINKYVSGLHGHMIYSFDIYLQQIIPNWENLSEANRISAQQAAANQIRNALYQDRYRNSTCTLMDAQLNGTMAKSFKPLASDAVLRGMMQVDTVTWTDGDSNF